MRQRIPLILSIYVAFVFLQSLYFKFAGLFGPPADITVYIFSTVGEWFSTVGLGILAQPFSDYGELVIGFAELLASILILMAATRWLGALIGIGVMTGAIFFHIFTPLGLHPYTDLACLADGCPKEYALFYMAIGVWLSCAYLLWSKFSAHR